MHMICSESDGEFEFVERMNFSSLTRLLLFWKLD